MIAAIVQLLRRVDLVPAGNARGVVVRDVLVIVADRADHVAFHDLHVVDVVQKLEALRPQALGERDTPRRAVALIVLVIHLRVEQLHADRDAVALGRREERTKAARADLQPLLIVFARRGSRRSRMRFGTPDAAANGIARSYAGNEPGVMLHAVEPARQARLGFRHRRVSHRTAQAVLLRDRPLVALEQLQRIETELAGHLRQLLDRQLAVGPPADGVPERGGGAARLAGIGGARGARRRPTLRRPPLRRSRETPAGPS